MAVSSLKKEKEDALYNKILTTNISAEVLTRKIKRKNKNKIDSTFDRP